MMPSGLTSDVIVEETNFLSNGDATLKVRLFRPKGDGPFPAVVECHGGGWCVGDRTNNDSMNSAVARHGILVAAIDFRMAPWPPAICSGAASKQVCRDTLRLSKSRDRTA